MEFAKGNSNKHLRRINKGDIYIHQQLIQPGDVLLTRGQAFMSKVIAKGTGGNFSHAALVLNSGTLFESDGHGVGWTILPADRIERVNANTTSLLSQLYDVDSAIILRHPNITKERAENSLDDELWNVLEPFHGLEYSKLNRLAAAIGDGTAKTAAARVGLSVLEKFLTKKIVPGPFCSELVTIALEEVGFSPFNKGSKPNEISPNKLFSESVLIPVNGAIKHADNTVKNDCEFCDRLNVLRK